jgi:assimilatory nitrate reductase catalytic subunit
LAYTTVLLQTITDIEGEGIDSPQDLNLTYSVPQGCTAGVQYVRAGNTTEGMVNITVLKDGKAMRYVPVAAGGAMHVPLSIVDELQPGTEISISAAAEGSGKLILDVGILEVNTS